MKLPKNIDFEEVTKDVPETRGVAWEEVEQPLCPSVYICNDKRIHSNYVYIKEGIVSLMHACMRV